MIITIYMAFYFQFPNFKCIKNDRKNFENPAPLS